MKNRFGPNHVETIGTMSNLASSYWEDSRPLEAAELYEEVLILRKSIRGADHPLTLKTMDRLAGYYYYAARTTEAIGLFEEILELRRTKLGAEHPDTLQSMHNLASCYAQAERTSEAIKLYEKVLKCLNAKAEVNPLLFSSALQLGELLIEEDPDRSADLLTQAYEHYRSSKPHDWSTFNTQSLLGEAFLNQENSDQAKPHLIVSYHGLKHAPGNISESDRIELLIAAVDRLIKWAEKTNDQSELENWQAEEAQLKKSPAAQEALESLPDGNEE